MTPVQAQRGLHILEEELHQHGLSVNQLTGLVLTHHDHDHMGAAAALKKLNSNIKIYSSSAEAPFISAQEKPLRLCQAEEMQKAKVEIERAKAEAEKARAKSQK